MFTRMSKTEVCLAALLSARMVSAAVAQVPSVPPAPARRAVRVRNIAVRHGGSFLGVGVEEINGERARALNLKEERGVEIRNVEEDSPASKAGLKNNDVVLEYNSQRVEGAEQFIRMVGETPIGRKVNLLIWRNGAAQTLGATIEARAGRDASLPFVFESPVAPIPPMPPIRMPDMLNSFFSFQSPVVGIESEKLNPQMAEFFGVKEGVLVRSVEKQSAAEKAGLKAGDVVLKVAGNAVSNPRDISVQMRSGREKKSVPFTVIRNHKEMTVEVKLEEQSHQWWSEEREVL